MNNESKRLAPHIVARKLLLEKIKQLMDQGVSQLPGTRALCAELDVSHITLMRVLKQLSKENRIFSMPRKGLFINLEANYLNIGTVLGDGNAVFCLYDVGILNGITEVVQNEPVYLRGVQLREPERAPHVLGEYGLDGCIWYMPGRELIQRSSDAIARSSVPIVSIVSHSYTAEEGQFMPSARVESDFFGIGRLRVEFMIARGHRKIACFTAPPSLVQEGFMAAISSFGAEHRPSWQIHPDDIAIKMPKILDEGEATAMVIDGGLTSMSKIFDIINAHPRGKSLELVIDYTGPNIWDVLKKHRGINVVAVNYYPRRELGAAAAKSILAHLREGRPLAPIKILSRIETMESKMETFLEDNYAS